MKHLPAFFLSGLILLTACSKKSGSGSTGSTGGTSDSATVTVIRGYGSGTYKVGDTVNIWSEAVPSGSIFDSWTGYSSLLNNAGEWHNAFIMPNQNVTVTGSAKVITSFTLNYEKIKGVNILKNVYYYFPSTQVGIVYLCHGTGGNAQSLVNNFEWTEMINDLVAAGYGIIVTEAEEVSLNTDLNGDGVIRWDLLPLDPATNPDYGNMQALADTFYARGYTKSTVPLYSIGMSDGGAFSAALSYILKYAAGVSYCAPTSTVVTNSSTTPLLFSMAKNDNNPEVGPTGNAEAQTNSTALSDRGICSHALVHDRSPVYPERFARRGDISLATSTSIYNELVSNHWLDSRNFLTASSDTISVKILANPSAYPVTSTLTANQLLFYENELDIMFAAHQFYSDYNKTTIGWLTSPCSLVGLPQ